MASAIQLNFTLRTTANCKTVHLLGSWDTYRNPLPLSKDSSKSGGWKGTFRFQDTVLQQGQRYWYYYIVDGYHVSHDPAREFVTEPTTGRKLNVLNIPKATGAQPQPQAPSAKSSRDRRHDLRMSTQCASGRPLSVSEIKSPRPRKPEVQTRQIRNEQFRKSTLDQLSAKFDAYRIDDDDEDDSEDDSDSDIDSDVSSDVPSLMSRSSGGSGASSPSSVSSTSSCCTCNAYGLTRAGTRVKLDCGGRKCAYSDGSDCSSDSDREYVRGTTRRQGIVVRR